MSDDEEAELRKEHLRLQNMALSVQLHDRLRKEQRVEAVRQLARDAEQAAPQAAKWIGITIAVGVGGLVAIIAVALIVSGIQESNARREKMNDDMTFVRAECEKGEHRLIVRTADGRLGSVTEEDVDKMPAGTRVKNCWDALGGHLP